MKEPNSVEVSRLTSLLWKRCSCRRSLRRRRYACELLEETEKEIRRLNQKKMAIIQDSAKGFSHDPPCTEQDFKKQGTVSTIKDDSSLLHEEKLLEQRKAEGVRRQVEEWMLAIPIRMQRKGKINAECGRVPVPELRKRLKEGWGGDGFRVMASEQELQSMWPRILEKRIRERMGGDLK